MIGLPQGVMKVSVGSCLYGFTINRARDVLVHILYLHKKMRFQNGHCTEYEYFKDSSIVYMDTSWFDFTVAL